jgi:hypothetical protein
VLDSRLEVRHLPGHLGAIGRQLCADGVEKGPELAELVLLIEIQTHAELALPESRQTAPDDMNRPQHQLRQQHRPEHRDAEGDERRQRRRPQRGVEIAADQQRRHADPDRSELGVAEQQRLAELQVHPLAAIDRAQLIDRRPLENRIQVVGERHPAALERRVGVRHRHAACVDNRRERHVLRVQTRLEDRSQPGIAVQRLVGVDACHHHLAGAVEDGVRQQLGTRPALVEADAGQTRQLHQAQDHDDHADDRGDAEDLLALDP